MGVVSIRSARDGDDLVVQELLEQLGFTFTANEVRDRLRLLAKAGTDPVLLACRDGEAFGLIALHFATMLQISQPVARIIALVVRENIRGGGIGRMLVDAGGNLARKSGCSLMELTTRVNRADAHVFYKRLGFTNSSLGFTRTAKEATTS